MNRAEKIIIFLGFAISILIAFLSKNWTIQYNDGHIGLWPVHARIIVSILAGLFSALGIQLFYIFGPIFVFFGKEIFRKITN